jgi:hypothetical protein
VYLRNWEHNATTGSPISGATVEARLASLTSPNTGGVVASTTTDANGMWEFPTLADAAHDIKITYLGNIWWHKGLTKHNVDTIFYNTPQPRTDQFVRNAGFEKSIAAGPWTVTNVQQTVFDSWQALNGIGSSAAVSRELTIHAADSDVAAKIVQTRVSGSFFLFQNMPIPSVFRGKTVTFSIQVRQGVGNSTRAYISDSGGTTYSSTTATTGAFQTLTVTRTIDAATTFVQVGVSLDVSDTIYVDNTIANLGAVAASYQPEYWYPGAVTDDIIGTRTPDQTVVAASGAQVVGTLLSMIANRIKAITGTTNWYDAPVATLAALNTALAAKVAKAGDTMTGQLNVQRNNAGAATSLYSDSNVQAIASSGVPAFGFQGTTRGLALFMVQASGLLKIVGTTVAEAFIPIADGVTTWTGLIAENSIKLGGAAAGNAFGNIPINNNVTNVGLVASNSLALNGASPGNASGNIPINNNITNVGLVASNSLTLGGANAGNASGNIPINNGLTNVGLVASNSLALGGASPGNAAGNIPINNGSTNTNLVASNSVQLGGVGASGYARAPVVGTYAGDGASNRAINLGFQPSYVLLTSVDADPGVGVTRYISHIVSTTASDNFQQQFFPSSSLVGTSALSATKLTATGFQVDNADSNNQSGGVTYRYIAFGTY